MDYRELASKTRSKFPGAYDDLDDTTLAQKIVSKYPQYSDTTFDDVPASPQEPSFAGDVVKAIQPEVQGPPTGGEGFLSRLARATRQTFFPTSMSEVKSLVNPNLGQYGLSRILEEEGKRLGSAVRGSLSNAGDKLMASPVGQEYPRATAAVASVPLAVAEGMSDQLTPSGQQQALGAEGVGLGVRAAGPLLKRAAVDPARRALGFQKSQLVSQKSPFETTRKIAQANRSAEAMLKEGAISPTGNVEDTIQSATKILRENSRKLSDVIETVDNTGKTLPVSQIDSSLIDELKPKFDDEFAASDKILKDLKAYSKDGLTLKEVDELKARWGKIGFQDKTVGSTAADMYRKAWATADKLIKRHVESVSPDLVSAYRLAKSGQENAINALRGLGNKQAADLGNNIFSLPTKVIAAGQLATGNVPGAIATAGVAEVLKRRGLAPVARGLYETGKALEKGVPPGFLSIISAAARRALDRENKTVVPAPSSPTKESEGLSGKSLSEFVRKAKLGTTFSFQGKKFKVVPQKGRSREDLAKASPEGQKAFLASKKRFGRGANTFAPA
jgi:hypothetical protein